ncbi:MAG: hypothetical protein VYE41_02595 [Candidatus Neomarinimicrobiota bacterium]|nr:hypothetical protein [Candidatus Neomarinimicrobiota bacterium]MED5248054.1 hypothetical protein [Candidatus Neomarinimicrobiota bacterium]
MTNSTSNEIVKEPNKRLRAGLAIMYVGLGINLFGFASLGDFYEGVGLLVMALGVGMVTAGYIYPNTGEELTSAVEEFEED